MAEFHQGKGQDRADNGLCMHVFLFWKVHEIKQQTQSLPL